MEFNHVGLESPHPVESCWMLWNPIGSYGILWNRRLGDVSPDVSQPLWETSHTRIPPNYSVQCTVLYSNCTVQYTVQRSTVQYTVQPLYCTVYCTVLYSNFTVHCTVYSTVYCAAQYSTVHYTLYSTVYCTYSILYTVQYVYYRYSLIWSPGLPNQLDIHCFGAPSSQIN